METFVHHWIFDFRQIVNHVHFQLMISKKKPMVRFFLLVQIPIFRNPLVLFPLEACHDHFRIDKEQSMLADCQRLYDRNEPLDKSDKYGITLVNEHHLFVLSRSRHHSYSPSYILLRLKHMPRSCVFSYNIMLTSIKLTTRELRHYISVLNMNKWVEREKRACARLE